MVKVVKAFPPNWNELKKVFPIKGRPGIVYAFGDRIYNPSGIELTPWIFDHENEHCKRQNAMGVGAWWDAYTLNTSFRLAEEIIAHRQEWISAQANMSFKSSAKYLEQMIARLSGPIYKHMIDETDARFEIMGYTECLT